MRKKVKGRSTARRIVRPAAPPAAKFTPRLTRAALLGGVSLMALAVTMPVHAADLLRGSNTFQVPNTVQAAASAAAAQAAAAARQAGASLQRSADMLKAMQDAQAAARAAAVAVQNSAQTVPNGLTPGGLWRNDQAIKADPSLWQGAADPTQSPVDAAGNTTVTIQQNQPKAILTWDTFNVGAKTTVDFQQRDANGVHSDWVALNRVTDPNARPSQILGNIRADGSVYVINKNGVIFGGSSQVNVHSLVASSLDVGDFNATTAARNQFFLNSGIAAPTVDGNSFSSVNGPSSTAQPDGDVVVQKGAIITTDVVQPDNPGFIYLFGSNVTNNGTLSSPGGEVALVAARSVALTPGTYQASKTGSSNANVTPTPILGTGFAINRINSQTAIGYLAGTGAATNGGLIETQRGITIMNGDRVAMSGVISADTSITRSSKIFLDAVTSTDVTGTITILPYENGETLPLSSSGQSNGSNQTFIPATIEASAYYLTVGDGIDGATAGDGQGHGLIVAPSAQVSLFGVGEGVNSNFDLQATKKVDPNDSTKTLGQEVKVTTGAVIDVSGLQDVQLPASYNFIEVQPRGQDLADSPLQRDGIVAGQTLTIDIRASGTRSDGTTWVGTPLFDASGYVGLVPQSIDQLMTAGGSVTIKTNVVNPSTTQAVPKVTLENGSTINMGGGYVEYLPGLVNTTRLIGADGHIYDISKADPNLTYVGIVGQTTADHPRAGITDVFAVPLANTTVAQAGYIEGRDAGGIAISTNVLTLNAKMLFGSQAGDRQRAAGLAPSASGAGVPKQASPYQLPSQGYFSLTTPNSVILGSGASGLPSVQQLSDYGLSSLTFVTKDFTLSQGEALSLAPGGRFSVTTFGSIDIEGSVTTPGGQISLTTDSVGLRNTFIGLSTSVPSNVVIGDTGKLDARGLWVNDFGASDSATTGPGFIDGGSISIATNSSSNGVDTTGNIILSTGSVLDVSSGGYINQKGVLKTNATGLPSGKGGDISLQTYRGPVFDPSSTTLPFTPNNSVPAAQVQLRGTLRGYGFAGGGTLTIATPGLIQVGGTSQVQVLSGETDLPASFFTSGGFGTYVVRAVNTLRTDENSTFHLVDGTTLTPQQQTYSNLGNYRGVATGSDISQIASIVTLAPDLRPATSLTVAADNIVLGTGSVIQTDPGAKIVLTHDQSQTSTALLQGSIIDPGGQLTIGSKYVWLGNQSKIDLSGAYVANSTFGQSSGYAVSGKVLAGGTLTIDTGVVGTDTTGFVVAEAGATVNVSGTEREISSFGLAPGQTTPADPVLVWTDGGTVSINTQTLLWDGTFTADAGNALGNRGTAIIGGSTLVLQESVDTVVPLSPGSPARPSTISGTIEFLHNNIVAPGQSPGSLLAVNTAISKSDLAGNVFATADKLDAFDTQYLYAGSPVQGGSGLQFFASNGATGRGAAPRAKPVKINGGATFDWSVGNRLYLAGSDIESISSNTAATIRAPYVMLQQGILSNSAPPAASNNSTLTIHGDTIDIGSAILSKFASTTFDSTGDIRLVAPPVFEDSVLNTATSTTQNPSVFYGEVLASGNLTFNASRIYPVSAVDFEIVSTSPTGTITFNNPTGAVPEIPLSAAGSLTVSAASIVQNGNLLAPLGQISLGARTTDDLSPNDPLKGVATFVPTQSVTLGPDSITSVSLGDTLVPYGQTEDGTNWFYNDNLTPLSAPDAKSLRLLGQNIDVQQGATMDLRGGGDLQAIEFVAGKGGTTDVLAAASGKPTVYALLPSRSDGVAAYDIDFTANLRDTQPLAGQQVYLSGGNGIAAGFYTLYPGHYATLPGALRLVDYGSALSKPAFAGQTLPDGTQIIGGYYTQSTRPDLRSAGTELFAVQTAATWRLYSEIDSSTATAYFAAKAVHDGIATPSLPIDGGRLTIGALNSLNLGAAAQSLPSTGGRGGELDLSGAKIELIGSGITADAGYTGIDVTQLDNSGFHSILIGGTRSDTADGTLITPTATDVIVDTNGTLLSVPELILVAAASTTTTSMTTTPDAGSTTKTNVTVVVPQSSDPTGNITVRKDSVIQTHADSVVSAGRNYVLGAAAPTGPMTASQITQWSQAANGGFGSLMMVSSDAGATVTRLNAFPDGLTIAVTNGTTSQGSLTLPALHQNVGYLKVQYGATIDGGERLVLDATATTQAITLGDTATLTATVGAKSVDIGASSIGMGDLVTLNDGVILPKSILDQLSAGDRLALKTYGGNINFYGSVEIDPTRHLKELVLDAPALVGGSGDVTIGSGGTLTLVNSGAPAGSGVVPHVGTLTLDAAEIDFGGGDLALAGFESVDWRASQRIFAKSSGTVRVGIDAAPVDLSIETPNVRVGGKTSGGSGQASQFTVTTVGNVTLTRPANATATPDSTDEIGGNLLITAASIDDRGTIQAVGGAVELHATSGDVTLGDGALIAAGGAQRVLIDSIEYVSGGKVLLTSDTANVVMAAGSEVNLSQPAGGLGSGGELDIVATSGNAVVDGAVNAVGGPGLGGTFRLDTGGGASLDALATLLGAGGVTGTVDIHTREGNLTLSQGTTLKALNVTLTADDAAAGQGQITIAGTIDASGYAGELPDGSTQAGGQVGIYGRNAITLAKTGRIFANTSRSDELGGDVEFGIPNNALGVIDLQQGSIIDVSGGSVGGLTGGTVHLRAPELIGQDDVAIGSIDSTIKGARSVVVEPFIAVDAQAGSGLWFDGIVDPAGLYDSSGKHIDGFWKDASGNITGIEYGGQRYVMVNGSFVINSKWLDPDQGNMGGVFAASNLTFTTDPSGQKVIVPAKVVDDSSLYNQAHIAYWQIIVPEYFQGNMPGEGFGNAEARFAPVRSRLGDAFHIQPGGEADNSNLAVNNGDITIASNWNLAAGTVGGLVNTGTSTTPVWIFDPATSSIQFQYRYGLEPVNVTFRAVRDINVNASLTDGFFQFHNYSDSAYQTKITNGFINISNTANTRTIGQSPGSTSVAYYANSYGAVPIAPYDPAANTASPVATANDMNPLGNMDIFPSALNVYDPRDGQIHRGVALDSASFRLVGGADMASANPNAVGSLALYGDNSTNALGAGHGNVIVDKHATYGLNFRNTSGFSSTATAYAPTTIRTGTGDIAISAARDLILADHFAPGTIITAGRNTALLPDPQYTIQGTGTAAQLVALNPDGFLEPQLLYYGANTFPTGPLTAAAFPEQAGDIDIYAGQDIIGFQNVVLNNEPSTVGFGTRSVANYQFYAPWLMAMAQVTPQANQNTIPVATGAGVFAPYNNSGAKQPAAQSSWWIEFGSFDQGVLSAGGDVRVTAGRDMRDFSVSLPSTGRVSGGLAAGNTPVLHRYDSGDLTVRVGRDLYSGSFYEGTGTASIVVGGSVRSDWTGRIPDPGNSTATITVPVSTVLAVDSGQINLTAAGSIAITNIINPAELKPQTGYAVGGGSPLLYMDTYGPNSAVRLTSIGGDVNLSSNLGLLNATSTSTANGVQTYPATLEITALSGNITTPQNGMLLTSSEGGDFNLLAYGSIDLTGGVPAESTSSHRTISAGASLIDEAFSVYQPNNGFDDSATTPALAHADDPVDDRYDRIYAVTGDITGNGQVKIARPVLVQAGNDIVDFNLIAQNIRPDDVSAVIAGHDLYYTGFAPFGGLQIAGPGYFMVEAGRDLGPFVVAANNNATQQQGITSSGNAAKFPVGNDTVNGNDPNNNGPIIGIQTVTFTGPSGSGKRNFLLPDDGATVVAQFGVGPGADYAAVASKYIDPTNASAATIDDYHRYLSDLVTFLAANGAPVATTDGNGQPLTDAQIQDAAWKNFSTALSAPLRDIFVHKVLAEESKATTSPNYAGALQYFLATLGISSADAADAWAKYQSLTPQLQEIFVDRVFFAELQVAGDTASGSFGKYQRGYQMVNTLFPAAFGYTANALDGGLNGAETLVKTGNLDLLHATIQTARGGDVLLMGPGGDALLGSTALEPNPNLKLNNIGLLTLAGGAIDTFTDGSVLVNQSRVFTEQGGDVLMWSSNADLNAGRGAKTTSSLPPLSVNIDSNDYQSIDLGGLVTGAGIGVLQTSDVAFTSDAFLIAPRGTVDAGDAGIRVSGNLSIAAAVVLHSDNISVGGSSTGVPVGPSVNVAALSAAGSASAAAANSASMAQPGAGPNTQPLPSIITNEVVGYGMPSDEQIERLRNQ